MRGKKLLLRHKRAGAQAKDIAVEPFSSLKARHGVETRAAEEVDAPLGKRARQEADETLWPRPLDSDPAPASPLRGLVRLTGRGTAL